MTRRKTDAEFRKEVKALVGDEYLPLDKYKNWKTKIRFKHQKCQSTFKMRPNSFLNGSRCPKCVCKQRGLSQRKSNNAFIAEVKSLVGTEYLVLDQYKGCRVKIRFKHRKCGNIFLMQPYRFRRGERCPKCSFKRMGIRTRKSDRQFKAEVVALVGKEYLVLGKYRGTDVKIKFKHQKCETAFEMRPNSFLHGSRCPKCAHDKITKTDNEFKLEIQKITKNEYLVLGKYINAQTKIKFKHKKCGNVFQMRPMSFLRGQRCPKCMCKESRGEQTIEKYLKSKGIIFETQFKAKDCRDKLPLPFDFAVFNNDQSINCLIEYQGWQHFIEPFKWKKKKGIFSIQSVLNTQKHDAMKLQYCKDHGIKLIRINHPQTSSKSNSIEFIERLVNRTLNKELHVV